jgi:hypothetical protein
MKPSIGVRDAALGGPKRHRRRNHPSGVASYVSMAICSLACPRFSTPC